MSPRMSVLAATLIALVVAFPTVASARKSPLTDAPMVRHKYEYRLQRFEVVPVFEGSVGAEYKHTLSGGVKVEYHLTDALSLGGSILFGTGISTGLYDEIRSSLPDPGPGNTYPVPNKSHADQHVNTIPMHGSVHLTFTPTFGKMSLFGKSFLAYDIYFFGGFGFANTSNTFSGDDDLTQCDTNCDAAPDAQRFNDPRNDGPHNAGFNPGVAFGGGLHVYFSKWVALDISLRNYMFADNPSGFDQNFDLQVDNDDRAFMNHLFVGVGVSLFFPPKIQVSR